MGYDDVIIKLGEFGRYQRWIYLFLCLPAISCALHKLSGVFLQAKVPYRCSLPMDSANGSSYLSITDPNLYFPKEAGSLDHSNCSIFIMNDTFISNATTECTSWIYDRSQYSSTTVMEWDWVCDRAWFKAISDALLMAGVMAGSIIFGDLSDRMGRRIIFFISLVMQVVFGILMCFAPDMYTFIFARFIVGSTTSGVFLVAYVLALEMVGPSKRMFAGVAVQLFFTTGFVLTAGFAYFIRDWRNLQLALTLPGILFFSYWWFIPESVRWLLTKGRYEEAKVILKKAAQVNGKELSNEDLEELCNEAEVDRKTQESITGVKPSLLDLFKYSNLRKKSLIIFFLWMVNSGAYYGLSWNTSNLQGNEYINFIISGIVEVPAYTFLIFTLNKWGRKVILCGSMIVAGIFLVASVFIPIGHSWMNVACAMAGKLAITASYGAIYIFSAEQFPTVIRNVGIGAASTSARIGGILAPAINQLADYWVPMPLLIFGTLALVGGVASLSLPETHNRKLPETIADGEQFGKVSMKNIWHELRSLSEHKKLNHAYVREAGGVCIADEVQIGFGRTGKHWWGFQLQGDDVIPDIVTIGKSMGNGFPVAAVVTTREVAQSLADIGMEYFNTYGGNAASCSAALAVMEVVEEDGLREHASKVGQHLLRQCKRLQEKHPIIGDVRGAGLFIGIELITDRKTRTPATALAQHIVTRMREEYVLISSDGPDRNVLKFKPPMVFNMENADELLTKLDKVLDEVKDVIPNGSAEKHLQDHILNSSSFNNRCNGMKN